jgi:hypothetical protein
VREVSRGAAFSRAGCFVLHTKYLCHALIVLVAVLIRAFVGSPWPMNECSVPARRAHPSSMLIRHFMRPEV